jgi:hypothetical protein
MPEEPKSPPVVNPLADPWVTLGQAWDTKFATQQHPKAIALIRARKPRALKYAAHH